MQDVAQLLLQSIEFHPESSAAGIEWQRSTRERLEWQRLEWRRIRRRVSDYQARGGNRGQRCKSLRTLVVNREEYAKALLRDGTAMARAAESNLSANVPSCPEWDVAELIRHTGGVHRFWGVVASKQLDDPREIGEIAIPDKDGELIPWFEEGVEWLAGLLAVLDPQQPNWSWSSHKHAGFVQRRMAQETCVHRWDAEQAAGSEQPIEPILAADGVAEIFDTFVPSQEEQPTGTEETVHLHQTDGNGEWLVTLTPTGVEFAEGHDKGDSAARGTGSSLLLALWGRIPLSKLETFGNDALLNNLLDAIDTT